ncbi:phage virion morphogenesis protein [Sphingobium yanoikuyae]|uniref:Phage virion morphogenesis protein n=1 Tax=Sphingobium yanoikuyae TaxID=13690 RepID=A0A9X7UBT4_SPHYA|nr:phage virion morphogenesis protein [Sphingobium yanoikuyae]QNG47416.1 phage virion morphogenesis protein [Sphingobium yanoikuyae]
MIKVEFKYQQVAQALGEVSRRLGDMTPIHQDIGEYVVGATKDRFKKGTAPDGTAWTPKKQATIDRYKDRGDGDRPDPLIGPSKRLSSEIAHYADAQGVEIGSSLEYSAVMQDGAKQGAFGKSPRGGPIPWGDIPARPWLGLSEEDEANIIDIADEHLEQAFNLSGFNG